MRDAIRVLQHRCASDVCDVCDVCGRERNGRNERYFIKPCCQVDRTCVLQKDGFPNDCQCFLLKKRMTWGGLLFC